MIQPGVQPAPIVQVPLVISTYKPPYLTPIKHSQITLQNHQTEALGWMNMRERMGASENKPRGGILADQMGLGKTIEFLALVALDLENNKEIQESIPKPEDTERFRGEINLLRFRLGLHDIKRTRIENILITYHFPVLPKVHATLVVSPKGVIPHWLNESHRFLAEDHRLKVYLHHRSLKFHTLVAEYGSTISWSEGLSVRGKLNQADIWIVTYSEVRNEWLALLEWLGSKIGRNLILKRKKRGSSGHSLLDEVPLNQKSKQKDDDDVVIEYSEGESFDLTAEIRQLRKKKALTDEDVADFDTVGMELFPIFCVKWNRVMLDEGHNIKNKKINQTRACWSISSDKRWVLTGTPIMNQIDDLHSLIHFLHFDEEPYLIKECILRRLKETVIELEGKRILEKTVTMTSFERQFYDQLSRDSVLEMQNVGKINKPGVYRLRMFDMIVRLQQACIHPSLIVNSMVNRGFTIIPSDSDFAALIKKQRGEDDDEFQEMKVDTLQFPSFDTKPNQPPPTSLPQSKIKTPQATLGLWKEAAFPDYPKHAVRKLVEAPEKLWPPPFVETEETLPKNELTKWTSLNKAAVDTSHDQTKSLQKKTTKGQEMASTHEQDVARLRTNETLETIRMRTQLYKQQRQFQELYSFAMFKDLPNQQQASGMQTDRNNQSLPLTNTLPSPTPSPFTAHYLGHPSLQPTKIIQRSINTSQFTIPNASYPTTSAFPTTASFPNTSPFPKTSASPNTTAFPTLHPQSTNRLMPVAAQHYAKWGAGMMKAPQPSTSTAVASKKEKKKHIIPPSVEIVDLDPVTDESEQQHDEISTRSNATVSPETGFLPLNLLAPSPRKPSAASRVPTKTITIKSVTTNPQTRLAGGGYPLRNVKAKKLRSLAVITLSSSDEESTPESQPTRSQRMQTSTTPRSRPTPSQKPIEMKPITKMKRIEPTSEKKKELPKRKKLTRSNSSSESSEFKHEDRASILKTQDRQEPVHLSLNAPGQIITTQFAASSDEETESKGSRLSMSVHKKKTKGEGRKNELNREEVMMKEESDTVRLNWIDEQPKLLKNEEDKLETQLLHKTEPKASQQHPPKARSPQKPSPISKFDSIVEMLKKTKQVDTPSPNRTSNPKITRPTAERPIPKKQEEDEEEEEEEEEEDEEDDGKAGADEETSQSSSDESAGSIDSESASMIEDNLVNEQRFQEAHRVKQIQRKRRRKALLSQISGKTSSAAKHGYPETYPADFPAPPFKLSELPSLEEQGVDPALFYLFNRYCSLCFHWMEDPILTPCQHLFCRSCYTDYVKAYEADRDARITKSKNTHTTQVAQAHPEFSQTKQKRLVQSQVQKDRHAMEPLGCPVCGSTLQSNSTLSLALVQIVHQFASTPLGCSYFGIGRSKNARMQPFRRAKKKKNEVIVLSDSSDSEVEVNGKKLHLSAKMKTLLYYLTQEKPEDEKIVIFSQWTSTLDLVGEMLNEYEIDFERFDGQQTMNKQKAAIEDFSRKGDFSPSPTPFLPSDIFTPTSDRSSPSPERSSVSPDPPDHSPSPSSARRNVTVLLASLRAAGVGLNLSAANHVLLLDRWWNPFVEEQAIDRVHRIGQDKKVTVVRLTVEDSIEQRIEQLQELKFGLAENVLANKGTRDTKSEEKKQLTNEDMQYLLSLKPRPPGHRHTPTQFIVLPNSELGKLNPLPHPSPPASSNPLTFRPYSATPSLLTSTTQYQPFTGALPRNSAFFPSSTDLSKYPLSFPDIHPSPHNPAVTNLSFPPQKHPEQGDSTETEVLKSTNIQ
ncbi:putative DNA repair protein rad5 [Blattamonas nauphoetae]|uniref:DNA repair protein rad5 n=1 Tax=Blattamonas nauphoetae TaxID=2049346 RepID=A0ABQ9XLR6_9EUKA|nr:putative DNA repair protein rad5 [Blattamonas nauphoetae]